MLLCWFCVARFQSTPLMRGETLTDDERRVDADISIHSPHARGDPLNCWQRFLIKISIHSPHARGDRGDTAILSPIRAFQSTPLMRGETTLRRRETTFSPFQSTPLMRGETKARRICSRRKRFQSTPLMRGETLTDDERRVDADISIHSPHARGDLKAISRIQGAAISIHSPHARGDRTQVYLGRDAADFNPLPSCEGRPSGGMQHGKRLRFQSTPLMRGETLSGIVIAKRRKSFQSTPLMRGETPCSACEGSGSKHFNPLPSCEGRHRAEPLPTRRQRISIHSPHARGDCPRADNAFQSTPLMRGETGTRQPFPYGDVDFNPLPSCEGRPFP